MTALSRTLAAVSLLLVSMTDALAEQKFHLNNVLGTSLDVTFYGVSDEQASRAVDALKVQLSDFEQDLSTWRSDSEISVLNRQRKLSNASQSLRSVLSLCEHWYAKSEGHFSCRLGSLKKHWQQLMEHQQLPDRVDVRMQARAIHKLKSVFSDSGAKLTLTDDVILDVAGLAKGWIIDQSMESLREQLPKATGIKLDIGGDVLFWGQPQGRDKWQVGLSADGLVADNHGVHNYIDLGASAVAASGHTSRYYEIERRRFSHLLIPQEGWPMDDAPSAIVVAPNAVTADAVATALSVQPPSAGIDWVNRLPDVEALVSSGSIQLASSGWHAHVSSKTTLFDDDVALIKVDYRIPKIKTAKYHRPYLAIWISDTRNRNVRHLLLLGESERWAKENTRWWRRVGRKTPGVIDAIARPTRVPGHYEVVWDGLDDQGQPVAPGEYLLHVEASREAGGHDYQKIVINTESLDEPLHLPAKGELGQVNIVKIRKANKRETELASTVH